MQRFHAARHRACGGLLSPADHLLCVLPVITLKIICSLFALAEIAKTFGQSTGMVYGVFASLFYGDPNHIKNDPAVHKIAGITGCSSSHSRGT